MPPPPTVSDAELEVLKALWKHGPSTVRDLESHLKKSKKSWAYTTILTLLSRLRAKRCVNSTSPPDAPAGAPLVFHPAITHQQLLGTSLTQLADRLCDGTSSPLVAALVTSKRLTPKDLADLRKLLNDLDKKGGA